MQTIQGAYTEARFVGDDPSLLEAAVIDQVQELVDHPAFTQPIVMQPDCHPGAGGPVGFTMPMGERIVPNIVGVDVGCGVTAVEIGETLPCEATERERLVRNAVPMGWSVHEYDESVHFVNEFPFERANRQFDRFARRFEAEFGEPIDPQSFEFDGYDGQYFKSLCGRVLGGRSTGMGHVIRSAGTLGGGNHFVEFSRAKSAGTYWIVVHSGSRYLGKAIAEHYQSMATDRRNGAAVRSSIPEEYYEYLRFDPESVSDSDLFIWMTGGMGKSALRKDRIREQAENPEAVFETLTNLSPSERNTDLDWLIGQEAHGYYVDMLFGQQYARWNRQLMCSAICDALDVEPTDRIESIHNYIDFEDLIVRKGATPARHNQRLVVPFNMAEGSIIARGRGTDAYLQTAPHGAGRTMSRREATKTTTMEEFERAMEGIYSESIVEDVLDEAPQAYKPADAIERAIEPTAEIIDRLEVVHNLKAIE
ncbi:RtcB family protein [Halocatena halophila]|uniref:RtcB family protein n=1 Tax=Halocatena halophila TaxID=2814576 RepID=UPI002ED0511B